MNHRKLHVCLVLVGFLLECGDVVGNFVLIFLIIMTQNHRFIIFQLSCLEVSFLAMLRSPTDIFVHQVCSKTFPSQYAFSNKHGG